ncbi:tetratricopeptide repeat protein [Formosa maritima]|uniref:Tetratricopeptide repeat protein n=1 Tax=Formosa maritima TaxID=2592046 RepID=A0A5D0GGE6_9FLAO|nr:tetratricopeptide repeat protein [Formosa maritima]TYA57956.1 hypothetical protein FVF61_03865 [Formosa maritima]
MNQKEFIYVLQNPQQVTADHTLELKTITEEFPYFQSARALYLKGLKNKESFKYNQELKTTAAYTTDRSILFDFITSKEFLQNEISQFIKQNTAYLKDIPVDVEDISVNKSVSIDEALKQQIKDTTGVLDPELFQPKIKRTEIANFKLDESEKIENSTKKITLQEDLTPDTVLNLGKPLQFHHNETHSFNEWLKLTRFKPIEREETNDVESDLELASLEREKKFDLIEKFIIENPKLKPKTPSSKNTNLAEEQMIQPESLMTETLARIYVEQKNYKKAIQSYNILILKYPEKSGFFADQIKAIKKLQEHNN